MPLGSASSQRFHEGGDLSTASSDTTKKAAPVDTVRLKKDIVKEDNVRKDLFNNEKSPDVDTNKLYNKSLDKSIAMRDTLSNARNKKP